MRHRYKAKIFCVYIKGFKNRIQSKKPHKRKNYILLTAKEIKWRTLKQLI